MINPLIAALGLDLDLSAEEIADVIWLATQMQQSVPLRARDDPPAEAAPQTSTPARENPFIPPKSRSEQKPQEPQGEIVSQGSRSSTLGRSQELAFQVPDVRSLREPLTLARSLRPLLRRIATGNSTVLNEAATIQRIVEEQLWIPVLQPSLEPWLDLALVVDESDSMLIWRRTVTELQRLLENYGVFRTVRVWGLVETADRVQIRPGFGVSARRQRRHSPSELIDPTGRCLVLVVSDCVAPLWQSGRVLPALKAWSQCGAMAIVQMLPEWLWRRTALGLATAVQLRALAPGLPNQQLTVSASESWDEADLETGIKVPVITLEPELFATWTQVVAGRGGVWTPGVVFEPSFAAMEEEDDRPSPDLTAEQRVQRFRLTASPMARRLAGLLAAAPVISLPIVRIVQDRLLSQSRQVHLAEVFLGGLLKPLTAIAPDTNPDRVQYDFFEGVREVLLESLPLPDSVDVLDAVSKFVASRMGLSLEAFAAVLRNPQQGQAGELAGQMRPFARVTAQVLKRMGGEYAKFAVELEGAIGGEIESSISYQADFFPYMHPIKILILTANPSNIDRLNLDREIREIKAELERSQFRDQFEIIYKGAARIDDLYRALQQHQPVIVHFSRHGAGENGLVLEDSSGQMKLVSNDALIELFRQYRNTVKCVFFNACYSETQAVAIYQQIDCIIGMNRAIGNETAVYFAPKFYAALAQGCSFQDAFDSAKNVLQLDSNPEATTPILKIRQGAAKLFFLKQSPSQKRTNATQAIRPIPPNVNSIGNISILGNSNLFNAVQGDSNTISQNINQSATSSNLESVLDALAKLKEAIATTDALDSYDKSRAQGDVEFIEKQLQQPKPDKSAIDRAIAALITALEDVVTLVEPMKKVAELLAKAWMV